MKTPLGLEELIELGKTEEGKVLLNETLAPLAGWVYHHKFERAHVGGGAVHESFWTRPGVDIMTLTAHDIAWGEGRSVPRFCADLNACHEVEMSLVGTQRDLYPITLQRVVLGHEYEQLEDDEDFKLVTATATQRTIALILTLQKA